MHIIFLQEKTIEAERKERENTLHQRCSKLWPWILIQASHIRRMEDLIFSKIPNRYRTTTAAAITHTTTSPEGSSIVPAFLCYENNSHVF